jgi:heme-degrading monooxygenase HmoA
MSIARNVHFSIRSGKDQEFTKLFRSEILPLLKKQEGFREELALVNGSHAMGISVWENLQSAEKYQSAVYPEILKRLTPVIEGQPKVEMYEVAATTVAH